MVKSTRVCLHVLVVQVAAGIVVLVACVLSVVCGLLCLWWPSTNDDNDNNNTTNNTHRTTTTTTIPTTTTPTPTTTTATTTSTFPLLLPPCCLWRFQYHYLFYLHNDHLHFVVTVLLFVIPQHLCSTTIWTTSTYTLFSPHCYSCSTITTTSS